MRLVGDQGDRADYGILVSIKRPRRGVVRIVVDRVSKTEDGTWRPRAPVTFKDFPERQIVNAQLSPEELEKLATMLLVQLSAYASESGTR